MPSAQRTFFASLIFLSALLTGVAAQSQESTPPQENAQPSPQRPDEQTSPPNQQAPKPANPSAVVPPSPPGYLERYAAYCEAETKSEKREWSRKFLCNIQIGEAIIAAFTVVLALITGVLAWIAVWQGIQMKLAVEATLAGDFPYLFLAPPEARQFTTRNPDDIPKIIYTFRNHGQTPAIVKEIRTEIQLVADIPNEPKFSYSPINRGDTILEREKQIAFRVCNFDRAITNAEAKDIWDGKLRVFFFGYVIYTDVFGYTHQSRFGLRYRAKQDAFTAEGVPPAHHARMTKRTTKRFRWPRNHQTRNG